MTSLRTHLAVARIAALIAASVGCVLQDVTTELRIRDPHMVTMRDSRGNVVIPPGAGPAVGPLAEGRMPLGEFASAGYTVQARREDDGSLGVQWTSPLPLSGGDRVAIVPASGDITLNVPGSGVVTREQLHAPTLVLPWCTRLVSHGYHGGVTWSVHSRDCVGEPAIDPMDISTPGTAHYSLEVPWTNVATLREHTEADRGAAWVAIIGGSAIAAIFGGLLLGLSDSSVSGGAATKYVFSFTLIGLALIVDAAMLPTLLAHDRDVDLHP